jgi:hypothetical protein
LVELVPESPNESWPRLKLRVVHVQVPDDESRHSPCFLSIAEFSTETLAIQNLDLFPQTGDAEFAGVEALDHSQETLT